MHITYIDSSKLYGSLPQEEYDFWRRAAHGAAPLDAVDYQGPRSAEGGAMPTCHQRQLWGRNLHLDTFRIIYCRYFQ